MGVCSSSDAAVAPIALAETSTLVVLPDGRLRELPAPARPADALADHPDFFVCDADEMEIAGVPPAVATGEVLRPRQLYFVLPAAMRRRPMRAEEIAALAVKASGAIRMASPAPAAGRRWRRRRRAVAPIFFELGPEGDVGPAEGKKVVEEKRKEGGGGGDRRRRVRFRSELSIIPELSIVPE